MCQASNYVIFLSYSKIDLMCHQHAMGKLDAQQEQTAVAEEKQQEKRSHPALGSALLFSRSLCRSEAPVQMTGRVMVLPHFQICLIKTVFPLLSYLPFTLCLCFFFLFKCSSLCLLQFSCSVHFFIVKPQLYRI